ncbi:MAG: cob(I)yrinic acid a,c-diamide adenosyltransferase [Eubacteriales bacterium]|nr:cob(I)yrinic acid a,c-diamide adenosyltransferase [Eubacteriales bacterium]
MAGLIHLYCGDGKGKTTAAVGLAVRASGAGKRVVFTQFFKDGSSSEVESLKCLGIRTVHARTVKGFYRSMTEQEREQARQDYTALFRQVTAAAKDADLLILDEIVSACNRGVVPEGMVVDFLRNKPQKLEVVLTGREPSPALTELADYITEMRKLRHPFDRGVAARKGIEY